MALYSKVEYWNERYLKSGNQPPYEWYQNYNTLAHLMNPETLSGCSASSSNINMDDDASANTTTVTNSTSAKAFQCLHPNNCRVLVLGCGNSNFGANLFEAGWRGGGKFVQLDFSQVVIEQMKERYNEEYYRGVLGAQADQPNSPRMEFLCCDVTQPPLPFENGSFDLIICKGLFDAVLCSAGSVFNIRRMVKECVRLLNDDGGVLMVVTYGNPDNRVVFLEDEDAELQTYWQGVSVHTVPSMVRSRKGGGHHNSNKNDYVYLCRKRRGAWKDSYAVEKTGVSYTNPMSTNVPVAASSTTGTENQKGPADSKLPAKAKATTATRMANNQGAKQI